MQTVSRTTPTCSTHGGRAPNQLLPWQRMGMLGGVIFVACADSTQSATIPQCHILLNKVATIGLNAGPAGPSPRSELRTAEGLYFVTNTFNPGEVSVFDSKGDYLHSIGSRGRGPAENMTSSRIAVSGDTVFVGQVLNLL